MASSIVQSFDFCVDVIFQISLSLIQSLKAYAFQNSPNTSFTMLATSTFSAISIDHSNIMTV